jgi:hypothetical protein
VCVCVWLCGGRCVATGTSVVRAAITELLLEANVGGTFGALKAEVCVCVCAYATVCVYVSMSHCVCAPHRVRSTGGTAEEGP